MTYWEYILFASVNVLFGLVVGRLIGHREMMSIINNYKGIAEDYKKLIYKERRIRNEIIEDYKKLVDLLRGNK